MRILKYKKTDRAKAKGQKRHAQNSERVKLHVSTGDTVKILRGDDKGYVGKVIRVYRKTGKVVVVALYITEKELQASADTVAAWKEELIPQAGGRLVSVDEYEVIAGDPGQG